MQKISDEELVMELQFRLEQSRKSLHDLSVVNRKLIEMNHKLEASESLKSNFLSNIRNEINNPLNAIIGLAAHLGAIVKKPEVGELVTMIFSEAFQLDFQLRNIFIAAELEAGEAAPSIERVEVISVVQGVLDNFKAHAAEKQVAIGLSVADGIVEQPLYFATDAQKLMVIVANLVANAVEYSVAGGEVGVRLDASEETLNIQVQDHGVGIAEVDHARIFDRFVQLDTGPSRAHLGHGLGLSVVRSLLDLLGGEIQLSSAPGVGSRFMVSIPAAAYDPDRMTFAEGGNLFLFDQMDET